MTATSKNDSWDQGLIFSGPWKPHICLFIGTNGRNHGWADDCTHVVGTLGNNTVLGMQIDEHAQARMITAIRWCWYTNWPNSKWLFLYEKCYLFVGIVFDKPLSNLLYFSKTKCTIIPANPAREINSNFFFVISPTFQPWEQGEEGQSMMNMVRFQYN
jgi:hypothetical protein